MADNSSQEMVPALTFTVAITGHQDILPGCHKTLEDQVSLILSLASELLAEAKQKSDLDRPRALDLRFVSALAPGADQIGARAALDKASKADAWQFNAILPFGSKTFQDLARATLEQRDAQKENENNAAAMLGKKAIDHAIAQVATLAGEAARVLELSDWRPSGLSAESEADWQSRRYATIGQMLVRRADLMIAMWDGNPPRGRGGTADVVSEARRSGVPVIWIDPQEPEALHSLVPDPRSNHLPASDLVAHWRAAAAGSVEEARFSSRVTAGADAAIASAIAQVLLGNDAARAKCVQRYLEEPPSEQWITEGSNGEAQPGDRHTAYAWMLFLFLNWWPRKRLDPTPAELAKGEKGQPLRKYPFTKARRDGKGPRCRVGKYPFGFGVEPGASGTVNAAPLLDHAARADALATRLGYQYRSAYVQIFGLAPIAVMWAVVSVLIMEWKPLFVVFELATVSAAAAIYLRTRADDPVAEQPQRRRRLRRFFPRPQDTHQRWLDARLIAESQRSGQLLAWIGFSGRRPLDPSAVQDDPHGHHGGAKGHPAPRTVWAPHFANAIAALPELPLDEASAARQAAITPPRVAALAEAAGKAIANQLDYHGPNQLRLEALNHRLDTFSLRAIQFAAFFSVSYLVLWSISPKALGWVPWPVLMDKKSTLYAAYEWSSMVAIFSGAVFPAVAAAAAGIRFQGDFERFAMRSEDTATRLESLAERARNLEARAKACGETACIGEPPLFEPLLGLLLDTQDVLDEDLADWRFAYAARPITLG